jgi:hypothetical protein
LKTEEGGRNFSIRRALSVFDLVHPVPATLERPDEGDKGNTSHQKLNLCKKCSKSFSCDTLNKTWMVNP